jgi:hypothetical protein
VPVEVRFTRCDDGVIDLDLGPEWGAFTETLLDAVTTRAPRGSDGVNTSTYWIDQTLSALNRAQAGTVIASGNATDLLVGANQVIAHAQYDTFDDQPVAKQDFVEILTRWRAQVTGD